MTQTTPPPAAAELTVERAAHQALRLTAEHPGTFGRLRTARIIAGYRIDDTDTYTTYASPVANWTLRDAVSLIDALLTGGLLAQTCGPRPTLVLTRAGFRALDALDTPPPTTEANPR